MLFKKDRGSKKVHQKNAIWRIVPSMPESLQRRKTFIESLTSPLSHIRSPIESIVPGFSNMVNTFRKPQFLPLKLIESPTAKIINEAKSPFDFSSSLLNLPSSVILGNLLSPKAPKPSTPIYQSLIGQIASHLNQPFSEFTFEELETTTNSIEDLFELKTTKLIPNVISYEAFLQILLSTIFFLYAMYSTEQMKTEIIDELSNKFNEILPKIEALIPKEESDTHKTFYTATRPLNVRSEPSVKAPIIDILYPNQTVWLIKMKEKWTYVEFFDYVEELRKTGWVYHKFLKKIKK